MDAFIGEIRVFPYNYCPEGFLECNGQVLSANHYQALYAVIGNLYGGSAQQSTFGLPALNGAVVLKAGQGTGLLPYNQGQTVGTPSVTLTDDQMPGHTHTITVKRPTAAATAATYQPAGAEMAAYLYTATTATATPTSVNSTTVPSTGTMHPESVSVFGTMGAHQNQQPFLALRFCIATDGEFPVRP